ncbi:MAG: hypothetical protein ACP5MH_11505 [Thermoproteus sp.]
MKKIYAVVVGVAIAALLTAYLAYAGSVNKLSGAGPKPFHVELLVRGDKLIALYDNGTVFAVLKLHMYRDSGIRIADKVPNFTTTDNVIKVRLKAVIENGTIKAIEVIFDNGTEIVLTNVTIHSSGIRKVGATNTQSTRPQIIAVSQNIGGTLPPGSQDMYGPYPGALALQFNLSWSPTSTGLCVGYFYAETGNGEGYCGWGGSLSYGFNLNGVYTAYAIVFNPFTATVTYQGTLTAYIW